MKTKRRIPNAAMSLSDVVALFTDLSAQGLARGQFGTVVEQFDDSRGRPMRTDVGAGVLATTVSEIGTPSEPVVTYPV
jgi:hypothetical protein